MPWPTGRKGVEKDRFPGFRVRVSGKSKSLGPGSSPGRRYRSWAFRRTFFRSGGAGLTKTGSRVSGFGFPENQSRWAPGQARGDEIGFDIRDDGEQGGFRGSGFRKIKVAGPRIRSGATELGLDIWNDGEAGASAGGVG